MKEFQLFGGEVPPACLSFHSYFCSLCVVEGMGSKMRFHLVLLLSFGYPRGQISHAFCDS